MNNTQQKVLLQRCSPAQDLAHAAVGDAQLPRDVARSDSILREFYDLPPDRIRQRATIDEQASKLVHTALSSTVGRPFSHG